MADHPQPEEIRHSGFRVVFRGFDQAQVRSHLEKVATALELLTEERNRMAERLGELAERDLKKEFESVGSEVAAVLEAARSAAEAMRERASSDAARWRSEAIAEVEAMRREARADAESMRSDAWTTGSQLLEEVQAEVERQKADLERLALAIRGEAEREAHRLTASARREAEDTLRSAKMEAERMVTQARVEHDDIISSAHRQAEAAQERARALEERRRELMDELESVRAALTTVEGELEERRHGIGLSEPPELPTRMVISSAEGTEVKDWEEGRTVRVIRPGRPEDEEGEGRSGGDDDVADADRLAEEVARLHEREEEATPTPPQESPAQEVESDLELVSAPDAEPTEPPQEPGTETEAEPEREAEPEPEPESEAETESDTPDRADDLSELFRRLRRPGEPEPEDVEPPRVTEVPAVPTEEGPHLPEGVDPFETRERLLLPITNATLRAVKRGLADAQNQALESLRITEGAWSPDPDELEAAFREDLDTLVDQATQAGVEAAIEMGMTGIGSLVPEAPAADDVGRDLVGALTTALEAAGSGSRERQAAVSRVFRGWRTDEAERRIRSVALNSYHYALRQALEDQERPWEWMAAGRLCPACRRAAENGDSVPPAHRDCQCTIVPT